MLRHAPVRLQRLIIAAIETCCRLGELLTLQWKHVSLVRRELAIRAEHAKDEEHRFLPISDRLCGVLEMARVGPDGQPFGPEGFVFGNAVGGYRGEPKKAWQTAVLKAHGHTPVWTKTKGLAPESQAAYEAIDLHFHDLRHEGGSRLLEAGWPIHHVQEMLGHASLDQTNTYLNAGRVELGASMRRLDASRCKSVAKEAHVERPPFCNDEALEDNKSLTH